MRVRLVVNPRASGVGEGVVDAVTSRLVAVCELEVRRTERPGHAMELAYMCPSFNNGLSLYDEFTPAPRQLSEQMVRWWGGFARFDAPLARGQPHWPRGAHTSGALDRPAARDA